MTTREADVVVIGAGLAGLVAATRLARDGFEVVVLEAADRVGGRTLDVDVGDGRVVELGGQWVGPTQDRVAALAAELGVGTFPTFTDGESLIELDGRVRRYSGTIPRVPPHVLLDIEVMRRQLDRHARRVPLEAPWDAPKAVELDGITFADWLRRGARTHAARRLVRIAGRTIWGAEPEELSLLFVLFYVHSAGGLLKLLDVEGGAQERRFEGGSQLLCTRLADELGAERVVTEARVTRIEQVEGVVTAEAERAHGGGDDRLSVSARRAIVAIPPDGAHAIEFDPPLPERRRSLLGRTAPGALTKCVAVYDEPFWRAEGLSGEAVSETGPVTLTFDNSPPEGRPGVLLGFVGGADARASPGRDEVLDGLARLYGPRAARPDAYLEQRWDGPVGLPATGALTAHRMPLAEPEGLIHWAGAETATRWCGYLDGAVRSGERAAREVREIGKDPS
jgi:monoamine oxidase